MKEDSGLKWAKGTPVIIYPSRSIYVDVCRGCQGVGGGKGVSCLKGNWGEVKVGLPIDITSLMYRTYCGRCTVF